MTSAPSKPRFSLIIAGGGIGGLTAAIGLGRQCPDSEIHLLESTLAWGEVGVGLGIGPNAVRAFELLGLKDAYKAVADIGYATYDPEYHWVNPEYRDGETGKRILTNEFIGGTNIHRPRLLNMLVANLPTNVKVKQGARITSATQDETGATVHYEQRHSRDGPVTQETLTADAVVAYDGVKSLIRQALYPDAVDNNIVYSGVYAYRGLVPMKPLIEAVGEHRATVPTVYLGRGKNILMYPISGSSWLNCVGFVGKDRVQPKGQRHYDGDWMQRLDNGAGVAEFEDFCWQGKKILSMQQDCIKWALMGVSPLPRWAFNRIILLGDAAHAMVPFAGAGAGMAIEDSVALAYLLASPSCTSETLPAFLSELDRIRRPRATRVQALSEELGEAYNRCLASVGEDDWPGLIDWLNGRRNFITTWDILRDIRGGYNSLKKQGVIPETEHIILRAPKQEHVEPDVATDTHGHGHDEARVNQLNQ